MCSHPQVRRRDAATQQGDALKGATLREGVICGRTAIPQNARTHKTLLRSIFSHRTRGLAFYPFTFKS